MNHSKIKIAPILAIAAIALLACTLPSQAFAQGPSQPNQSQHAQATPLPLSGRAGNSGSVTAIEAPIAGTTNSVTTINPSVQVQGPYAGSSSSTAKLPFAGKLSLRDAIQRGLNFNLGAANLNRAALQAQGQSEIARSALLPNVSGYLAENLAQTNLAAEGLRIHIPIPGFNFPTIVGPYNNIDLRGSVSQSVLDLTAWNNFRASSESVHAAQLTARDARDAVVLAVCGTYLQIIATKERVASAHAQLDTATALFQQTQQKRGVGLVAQIDVDRSEVEQLTQQQRVISLETELAKQKIALARITGLPPNDAYDLTDEVPFAAAPALTLDDAIHQALDRRSDIKAAEAQVRAAQRALSAARDERLPSLSVNGNYGAHRHQPRAGQRNLLRRRHAQHPHLAGRPHRGRHQIRPGRARPAPVRTGRPQGPGRERCAQRLFRSAGRNQPGQARPAQPSGQPGDTRPHPSALRRRSHRQRRGRPGAGVAHLRRSRQHQQRLRPQPRQAQPGPRHGPRSRQSTAVPQPAIAPAQPLTATSTDNFLNDPSASCKKNSFQFVTAASYSLK